MAGNTQMSHDSRLVDLIVDKKRAIELNEASKKWPDLSLTNRQLCDLELLINGGFSPLTTFMNKADYESVCHTMRLANGALWPMPITLDISEEFAAGIKLSDKLALRGPEGVLLAVLTVSEMFRPDLEKEAARVFGTNDELHPGVNYLKYHTKTCYVSGKLEGLQLPVHYDFSELRRTPRELRKLFKDRGWTKVVAFQTRNPMHRAHVELASRAAREAEANLLIHPVVGMTRPGDVDYFTRVRIYQILLNKFPASTTSLSLLPLAMRMGGPREALWHALIRKNYGVSHFIVGRDHAGPGKNSRGEDFYKPYESEKLVENHADEIGLHIMRAGTVVFVPSMDKYLRVEELAKGTKFLNISGTEVRERLSDGRPLPNWFTYPEVAQELRRAYPQRSKQGFCVFFTGLSGAGKSAIANAAAIKLLELGGRQVTLLDGDIVRKNLSSELGFSRNDRDINIRRIGFVAAEIAKHGGIVLCAPIAPYDETRKAVRSDVVGSSGGFILAYVNTPIDICEKRDRKGLYKKARSGEIKDFTGVSDPYEVPSDAEIVLNTELYSAEESAQQIVLQLERKGYIKRAE